MGRDIVEYRLDRYPDRLDNQYVSMLEKWFSVEEGVVVIRLARGGSNPFRQLGSGDLDIDEYIGLLRRVRTAIANTIYSDAIYIAVVEGDLWGFPLDIVLASDYVGGEGFLESRGYSHLLGGIAYGMFRGGNTLLNLLGGGAYLNSLVRNGLLASIKSREALEKYDSLLLRKRVLREVFLRDYHHILEIEETIVRRYFSSI